jgi:CRP-like cAMP-binding protein
MYGYRNISYRCRAVKMFFVVQHFMSYVERNVGFCEAAMASSISASSSMRLVDGHELPSQNQLYAILMLACGAWRVTRPHRRCRALVDDIESRPEEVAKRNAARLTSPDAATAEQHKLRAAAESRTAEPKAMISRGEHMTVAAADSDQEDAAPPAAAATATIPSPSKQNAPATPLADLREVELGSDYYGNANLCVLLDLLAHLPLVESVDWSGQTIFAVDAYKMGVSGNEVIRRLCAWASRQRSLRKINLGSKNPVGTRVVHYMIQAANANPNLVEITFDESGVEAVLLKQLHRALEANRQGKNQNAPPQHYRLTDDLKDSDTVDRKTSTDRRELHALLREFEASFVSPLHDDGDETSQGRKAPESSSAPDVLGAVASAAARAEAQDVFNTDVTASTAALGASPVEQFLTSLVSKALKRSTAEVVNNARGLRGDGGSLYVVDSGALTAHIGGHDLTLSRGDYFGELLEAEMYVAGQLAVEQRGHVYQIPRSVSERLMRCWEARVARYLPILKQVAVLQPLPSWVLIRACHDALVVRHVKNTIVVSKGSAFQGLFIVTQGTYLVRGRAKSGRSQVIFSPGDVFGQEAAVSRLTVNTVEIKACSDDGVNERFVLSATLMRRFVVPHLRTVLSVHAKAYCDEI